MRPVGGITNTPATGQVVRGALVPTPDQAAGSETGRVPIAIAPPASPGRAPVTIRRPAVGFLAQLIATAEQLPQTRSRRRIDPGTAIARYRTTADPRPAHRHLRDC